MIGQMPQKSTAPTPTHTRPGPIATTTTVIEMDKAHQKEYLTQSSQHQASKRRPITTSTTPILVATPWRRLWHLLPGYPAPQISSTNGRVQTDPHDKRTDKQGVLQWNEMESAHNHGPVDSANNIPHRTGHHRTCRLPFLPTQTTRNRTGIAIPSKY
jgi:hypothetical protein